MEEINLKSIGNLQPHPNIPDEWLISKPISVEFFDGKELKFIFNADLENDKDFLSDANQTIQNFLEKDLEDKLSVSNSVYKNYRKIQDYYDSRFYDIAPLKLNNESEIWNYVYPDEIYIGRSSEDKNMYLQVHCGCEWEVEHGLQLVFKNGLELTRVSGIDCSSI